MTVLKMESPSLLVNSSATSLPLRCSTQSRSSCKVVPLVKGAAEQWSDKGILCYKCELWYHCSCVYLDMAEYRHSDDPCYCSRHLFPPLSNSYFDSWCFSIQSDSVLNNDSETDDVSLLSLQIDWCCHHTVVLLDQCKQQSLVLGNSVTWLDSTIMDSVVALPGYDAHRRDRNRKGEGVMVFVSHHDCDKCRLYMGCWKQRSQEVGVCTKNCSVHPNAMWMTYWLILPQHLGA